MHGEAEDGGGEVAGVGDLSRAGGEGVAIGGEVRDEGIEVAAGKDSLFLEGSVQLIAGAAVGGGINEDGEV